MILSCVFLHKANNYISDDSVHSSGWVLSPSVFLPNTGQSPIREKKLSQVLTPAGQTASHKQVGCPQPLLGCFSFVFAFAIDIRLLNCDLLPCPVLTDRVWSFFLASSYHALGQVLLLSWAWEYTAGQAEALETATVPYRVLMLADGAQVLSLYVRVKLV